MKGLVTVGKSGSGNEVMGMGITHALLVIIEIERTMPPQKVEK